MKVRLIATSLLQDGVYRIKPHLSAAETEEQACELAKKAAYEDIKEGDFKVEVECFEMPLEVLAQVVKAALR